MHYLRKELERLVKYAQGLGVKVTFSKSKHTGSSAEWMTDGSEITIYNRDTKGPLALLFDFFHELAHHRSWIERGRKESLKTNRILDKQDEGKKLTEAERKHIYEDELNDSKWQTVIHNEIGSKVPLWRLKVEIEVDMWIYEHYWLKGRWPLVKNIKAKRRKLMERMRP